jgi:ankyrin repeat protein
MTDTLKDKLYRALTKSDVNMLRTVIQQGVSLAYEAEDHYTPFHEAVNCGRNDLEILQLLYDHGAEINARTRYDDGTALHWATGREAEETLPWLLAHGADVNAVDKHGRTPLITTVAQTRRHDDEEQDASITAITLRDCEALLAAGADVNAKDNNGQTALHHAAINGLAEIGSYLIGKGAKIGITDSDVQTALYHAVQAGHLSLVQILLNAGACVNATNTHNQTLLHILAEIYPSRLTDSHREICQLLIMAGVNLESVDWSGSTALCYAAANEDGLSGILLKAGANTNAKSGEALRQAVFLEHTADVELLLIHGADPELSDPDDLTASLHIAADEWYEEGACLLIKHGAAIEQQNIDGETPLCVAARVEAEDVASFLLNEGANPLHTDHYGNSPLYWAKRKHNNALCAMIQKKIDEQL